MSDAARIIGWAGSPECGGKAARVMEYMLAGEGADEAYAAILRAMAAREQSDAELTDMLDTMRRFMSPAGAAGRGAVDVCGTGGDGLGTFNISTAAAFAAAAAGATVAKHGNRSSTGGSGSAEIFEGLGVDVTSCDVDGMLDRCGISFMFAPRYHPAARHVAAARRALGMRTVFNTLGPLCNPAGVLRQLVGVSDASMVSRMPRILARAGAESIACVMSGEGADELLAVSGNLVCTYRDGKYRNAVVRPEDLGIPRAEMSEVLPGGRDPMAMFVDVVCGRAGSGAVHTAAMNAGAGLHVAGLADGIPEGFAAAMEAIESGKAEGLLDRFVRMYGDPETLEGV